MLVLLGAYTTFQELLFEKEFMHILWGMGRKSDWRFLEPFAR
jgi:hypothetical protein